MPKSKFDPLTPGFSGCLNGKKITPHHEDRVLVKWIPPPEEPSIIHKPMAGRQQEGPQMGIVVAVGKGNTGITKLVMTPKGPKAVYRPFKGEAPRVMDVQPGDKVLYERVPAQEYEIDGVLHTFVYEENHIIAVLG